MVYQIPAREIPVYGSYDVCVVGGGTAGSIAAISAAREGLSVLVVEQFGALGGSGTLGLVLPVMPTCIPGNPQCSYFGEYINQALKERGYNKQKGSNQAWQDSLYMKFVLDELATEYGVEILYHAFFNTPIRDGNRILGITCTTKRGEQAVYAKRVIDCTGDADVAIAMGCAFDSGDPERDGKNQPTSLRYIVGGIDLAQFATFVREHKKDGEVPDYPDFNTGSRGQGNAPLDRYFEEAVRNGELDPMDYRVWMMFCIPGRPDSLAFNCPEFRDRTDATNPQTASWMQTEGRRRIERHLRFYKKYLRGFENAYIAEISPMIGIRESNRIHGEYTLTYEDVISYRKFEDSICQSSYPIDIHGVEHSEQDCFAIWRSLNDPYPYYDIPYPVMIPKGYENLLVAGRCAGFDYRAQASARMQHSCRAMGEAAGIACRLSITRDLPLKAVNGKEIRQIMIEKGAIFAPIKDEFK